MASYFTAYFKDFQMIQVRSFQRFLNHYGFEYFIGFLGSTHLKDFSVHHEGLHAQTSVKRFYFGSSSFIRLNYRCVVGH